MRFATGGKEVYHRGKEVCHRGIWGYRRENNTWKTITSLNLLKRGLKCLVAV